MRVHFRGYFCDRVHGIAEIHWWQDKSVNGHDQFQIAFMMKLIDSFLVNILIIILGMIIILHEWPGAEVIDCGWDTCDRHGEIIRPCLDGRENRDPVRICFLRDSQAVCKLSDEICIFIGTADGILSIVCVCRKFKFSLRSLYPASQDVRGIPDCRLLLTSRIWNQ